MYSCSRRDFFFFFLLILLLFSFGMLTLKVTSGVCATELHLYLDYNFLTRVINGRFTGSDGVTNLDLVGC